MNPQRLRNLTVVLVTLLLFLPTTAQAQSESTTPYKLHIVVRVAENRLLTDVFRERIEDELRDGFRAALGDMGEVEVSHDHPRLPDVVKRGLKLSLDSWTDRTDGKTHFVLIDYSGVHYEIQTRQYDGTVGRASPVVRHDRTRDRDFVAKAAALLIKQDFGVLGTVMTAPEPTREEVTVELRGGGLGDLSRWVKQGEVFALVPPGGGSPRELEWSLLQVEKPLSANARDCRCRFFHRYKVRRSIAGYRCIKLGTVQTALRLRWYETSPDSQEKSKPLNRRISVEIRHYGFDSKEARLQESIRNNTGVLETVHRGENGVFSNVAFVRVTEGLPDILQVPIALVDDQPIIIDVDVSKSKDLDPLFNVRLSSWRDHVADSLKMQVNLFKRLETLGEKAQPRQEIIQAAKRGLASLQNDLKQLQAEKIALEKAAKHPLKTEHEDKRLAELKKSEEILSNYIEEQEKFEATENNPQRRKWLSDIGSAKLLEEELEIGKAIAIYERIQKEGFNDATLDAHLKELHELWDTESSELKEARGFIYGVWPTLDTSHLEENIPKAKDAFEKCIKGKKDGDLISIKKLLKGTEQHADRLSKELGELRPNLIAEDVEPARKLQKVSKEIVELGTEIQNYQKAAAARK